MDAAAVGRANHQRTAIVAVGAVARFGRFADDLVERRIDEVGELNLGDRPQPLHRHPDGDADNRRFRQRHVDDALRAELFEKAPCNKKDVPTRPDVFTDDKHAFVGHHRFVQCQANGI